MITRQWISQLSRFYLGGIRMEPQLPPLPVLDGVDIRHIPGLTGYAASADGGIWSCKGGVHGQPFRKRWRRMSLLKHPFGHLRVHIRPKLGVRHTVYAHRLVLMAFVGPCPDGMQCCHKNGIPDDNRIENLRWDTPKENAADAIRHGTHACLRGLPYGARSRKLDADAVRYIKSVYITGHHEFGAIPLSRKYGVANSLIYQIMKGKCWAHVA